VELPTVFTGLLDTGGLVEAYSAADLVLHASVREIFPNAVGEAMACGLPVVAVDAGGTGELLGRDGSTGLLVPPDEPAQLARILAELLTDEPRRRAIGAAARRRIEEQFSLVRMVDGYESALEKVIASDARHPLVRL
ncbi:MAG TPA: glycosyltransferase, partial [Tepidiformaceae bacterium]|nr:glycosyltransferase [Tepidiformaceae bacterium]